MRFIVQIIGGLLCILCITLSVNAQPEPTATLSLTPAAGTFTVGEIFDVNILLDTGGHEIDGVDIRFLNYDPNILEVQDADPAAPGVQIMAGTLMSSNQLNEVDPAAGTIDFGQITSGGARFIGSGVLATVTFEIIGVGITDLFFDFTPGNTRDTNVASGGNDVLASATGAQYTTTAIIPVTIDIKPGSDPNSINCTNENEVISVVILTTDDFDATTVDHTTVTFEGATEIHTDPRSGEPRRHEEDVDGDADIDLVFHFRLGDTGLSCGSTKGTLNGETFDGTVIEGTDSVNMISS